MSILTTGLLLAVLGVCIHAQTVSYVIEVFMSGSRNAKFDVTSKKMVTNLQITANGMRTQFVLGSLVRSKYQQLFGSQVAQSDYSIRISNTSLAFMSAQSHAIGLSPYEGPTITTDVAQAIQPPFGELKLNYQYAVQNGFGGTEVQLLNKDQGDIFLEQGYCTYYENLASETFKNLESSLNNTVTVINDRLSSQGVKCVQYFGDQCKQKGDDYLFDLNTTYLLYDYDFSYFNENGKYYLSISDGTRDMMRRASLLYRIARYMGNRVLVNIINHFMLKDVLGTFAAKNNQQIGIPQKYLGYSANDTNIIGLLVAFNQTSIDCLKELIENEQTNKTCYDSVPFSSNIIFELVKHSDFTLGIQTLFNNKVIPVCEGSNICSDTAFRQVIQNTCLVDNITMTNICQNKFSPKMNTFKNSVWFRIYLWILSGSAFIGIILLYVIILAIKNKTLKENYQMTLKDSQYKAIKDSLTISELLRNPGFKANSTSLPPTIKEDPLENEDELERPLGDPQPEHISKSLFDSNEASAESKQNDL